MFMLFLHKCHSFQNSTYVKKIGNPGYKRENKFKLYEKQVHPRLDHLNFSCNVSPS